MQKIVKKANKVPTGVKSAPKEPNYVKKCLQVQKCDKKCLSSKKCQKCAKNCLAAHKCTHTCQKSAKNNKTHNFFFFKVPNSAKSAKEGQKEPKSAERCKKCKKTNKIPKSGKQILLDWCYYPHPLRDSVPTSCGIFRNIYHMITTVSNVVLRFYPVKLIHTSIN